jgi:starch phosphorylase
VHDGRATINNGSVDIARAVGELADRLPAQLAPLARLAYNYRWSWLPGAPELFEAIDPDRFKLCLENPVRLLQEASAESLRRAAGDTELLERASALEAEVSADLERPSDPAFDAGAPIAFLCAEYGVHLSLPV